MWLQTLWELIPALDKEVLKSDVLSLALSKGDVDGNVGSKVMCTKILAALAPRLVSSRSPATRSTHAPCAVISGEDHMHKCTQ